MFKRKWLAFLLCFLLVFPAVTVPAGAEETAYDFISIKSNWKGSVFGDVGGQGKITSENFEITENSDGTVKLRSSNNCGKIASSSEGIAFYYQEIPSDTDFEFTATATVESFDMNNQVSFGIMLRDKILINESSKDPLGSYIAVGPIDVTKDPAKYTFSRNVQGQSKQGDIKSEPIPAPGNTYRLSLKKTGNIYVLTFGNEEPIILDSFTFEGDILYAGLYTSRNTSVVFSDIQLISESPVVDLLIDYSKMKTSYLRGEALDLKGLEVTACYSDGKTKTLSAGDYVVTGFDSSVPGTNTISINFGSISRSIDLEILPLTCTNIKVKYLPAKTDYYIGDIFNPDGLTVLAEYNNGYKEVELSEDKYMLSVSGQDALGYVFNKAGIYKIEVIPTEEPSVKAGFEVNVSAASIESLEIKRGPLKTVYFIGDELDLTGLAVYARYSDGTKIRLDRNEYTVSNLDSSSAGEKEIIITHKGKTALLTLIVKEKSLMGLEITKYPKTTYFTGESFNAEGLEVSRVYDNGDKEILEDYTIDASAFNSTVPGVYDIIISCDDFEPVNLKVTVREQVDYEWKATRFGQSTSESKNHINFLDNGAVEIIALEGGGKIATDHDGITFYYTEIDAERDNFVLSADIKVKEYAKNPHDGQESFGIMARDAIGNSGDSSVFASNIAAIGGFSGGTKNPNGTQLFIRTGVTSPDGTGSQGIKRIMINDEKPESKNTHPEAKYRLTLAKTNSGYAGKLNNGEEVIFFEPGILNVQDSRIYVGFYAARLATIEVSNIEFAVSSAETDAPRVIPPEKPVTPSIEILSPDKTSGEKYSLVVKSNVNGSLTVKQGGKVLVQDSAVVSGEKFSVDAVLEKNSENPFTLIFLPDDTQNLSSFDKIIKNFSVTMKTYNEGGNIYVSPSGTPDGDGTRTSPLDLDTAVAFVKEGQKIILLPGVYKRNSSLVIPKYNNGTAENRKYMVAAPDSRPVIDFDKKSQGVILSGDYWHIEGIDFARSAPNYTGFLIGGNHNIIENCRFYENGDTGLQISRTDSSDNIAEWPSYNRIINCESFDNRDPSDNNADGFAAKITSGRGNEFIGCVAHHNIDDGWDLYTKAGTGEIGAVIIESCISYENGTLTDGTVGKGDKNGFKLGGEGIAVPHIIRNSLAFNNGAAGFTSNSNPGVIAINNIAYNNAKGNLVFTTYSGIPSNFILDGFISYNAEGAPKDVITGDPTSDKNYLFDGKKSVNKSGNELSKEYFIEALLKLITRIKGLK
ncbi:MAG TPA: bacterial Ig-like domain-containing protein [Thermoclostridium sp.]